MKLSNMLKKLSSISGGTVLILLAITLHFLASPIYAQTTTKWYVPTPQEHQAALELCKGGNVGLECTVQAVITAIINSLGESAGPSPATGATNNPNATLFASRLVIKLISYPPISSQDYVQYLAQKVNPIQSAYAQGETGYRALSSVIALWTAMRNVAYLAFVIIFIAIGFLIMFRAKLDPQTVVNIQNSLPGLVVTLLLITFSYAIAGFLVDLIYLGIFLAVSTFASQGLIGNPIDVRNTLLQENIFTLSSEAGFFRHSATVAEAVEKIFNAIVEPAWMQVIYQIVSVGGFLVSLIIKVAVLFSLFKLFFQLILAYVNIIISTVLGPILILFNALPGSQSFSNWLRNFLANVLIFPAVAFLFLMSAVLIGGQQGRWQVQPGLTQSDAWTPPFIQGAPNQPLTLDQVVAVIGLGFVLFAPQMVTLLQQSLKAKPLPAAGIFAPIAAGGRVVTAGPRAVAGGIYTGARTFVLQKVESIAGETKK